MGWLSSVEKQGLAIPNGTQGVMVLDAFGGGRPNLAGALEADGSFSNYASAGYGRNELVYACVRYRAESLPQAVLRVYPAGPAGTGAPIDDHRLRTLFEKPNPITGEFEFFELSVTYKDLAGTCFWLTVKGRDGLPSQLWPLRPDLVGVLPDPNDPAAYVWIYRPDPQRPEIWIPIPDAGSPAAKTSQTSIIRVRYPNPNPNDPGQRYFGQPPLRPAARAVSLDNAATDFVDSLLRNHAQPSVVIESEAEVTPAVHERLTSMWTNAFGGPRRGRPAFLQKGMKIQPLGMTPQTLEFPDLRDQSETRICGAFGVEPILVGAKIGLMHNAYKDYREARLAFWEEAMFSEQRRFIEPVRSFLLPGFQGAGRRRLRMDWDNSGVLALKEAEGARWTRAVSALQAGGITRNQFLVAVGLPAIGPIGDVFLNPGGVTLQAVDQEPTLAEQVSASLGLVAAEYGIELSDGELETLLARTATVEG